jgi:hypothetical protein
MFMIVSCPWPVACAYVELTGPQLPSGTRLAYCAGAREQDCAPARDLAGAELIFNPP